jgi:hypothetical protein
VTGEVHSQAEVGSPLGARHTLAAIGSRIRRDTLPGARPVNDDPAEFVAQNERPRQAGVTDARLLEPVEVRATQPDGGHAQQNLARTGSDCRLIGYPNVASAVDSGDLDQRLSVGHLRACP